MDQPETIPKGQDGDVYVLRRVMHDWNDEQCRTILQNVKKAMGSLIPAGAWLTTD